MHTAVPPTAHALTPGPAIAPGQSFASEATRRAAMHELVAHVQATPTKLPPRRPKKLNLLDQEPLNAMERHALADLRQQGERGGTNAQVLQELIGRIARALDAYRSSYPPPIN